jgi:hypothetical protein
MEGIASPESGWKSGEEYTEIQSKNRIHYEVKSLEGSDRIGRFAKKFSILRSMFFKILFRTLKLKR